MKATTTEALNKGILAQKKGLLFEAAQIYSAILIKFPSQPDALHNLGVLFLSKGNEQQARTYLKTARTGSNPAGSKLEPNWNLIEPGWNQDGTHLKPAGTN